MPIVLAESDSSCFMESITNNGTAEWLEFIAKDLRYVKSNSECDYDYRRHMIYNFNCL